MRFTCRIWLFPSGVTQSTSAYNMKIQVMIENNQDFDPAEILEEMEQLGIQFNRVRNPSVLLFVRTHFRSAF